MSLRRVFLLVDKERKLFFRGKKPLLLALMLAGLGLLQFVLLSSGETFETTGFGAILYGSYNLFVQLLPLALTSVLAGSVCQEKEDRTWFFYTSKTFTKAEIVLSKIFFYTGVMSVAVTLAWVVTIGVAWQSAGGVDVPRLGIVYLLMVVLSVSFMITCMEIAVSAVSSKTSLAGLAIVIVWFVLFPINLLAPPWLGREYIAPYAYNSIQTGTVMRILGMVPVASGCPFCESFSPTFPTLADIARTCLYTVTNAAVFIFIGLVGVRRN